MGFDQVYEESRRELYVALALATGSRDVAADTVDDAFRAWHGRVLRRRLPEPAAAAVMSIALRRIARMTRGGADVPQGFRLRSAPLDEGHRRTFREFRSLPLAPRMALVLLRRIGWDPETVAAATGLDPASLDQAVSGAMERLGAALGVDADDAGILLEHALTAEAEGLREPISRGAGMRKAGFASRVLRAVAGAAVIAAASVGLVAGVSAIDLGASPPPTTAALPVGSTSPGGSTTVVTGPATLDETRFSWLSGALPIGPNSGDIRSISSQDDQIVILGMEHAQRTQAVLARSKDGLEWELLGSPFVGDGDIVALAASDGHFAAAGNRWDGNGNSSSVWLSEDGFDWVELPLPLERTATLGGVDVQVFGWVQRVDVIGDEVLAIVQTNAELDERVLQALLPGGVGNGGWGTSTEGIQVFDQRGQETFFAWDELGLADDEIALLKPGARVFSTTDRGATWSVDTLPSAGGIVSVAASDDLIAVVIADLFGHQLWLRSGAEWRRSDVDLAISAAAVHGGMIHIVGQDAAGAVEVWRSPDAETWESVLGGVEPGQYQLAASDSGVMLWSLGTGGLARPVEIEIDGFTVQVFQTGGVRVLDGDDVVAEFSQERIFMGGDGYQVTDADGDVILELSGRDIEMAFVEREEFAGPFDAELRLYTSDNGLNWSRVLIDGGLPDSFFPFAGVPTTDGVALLGWDQRGAGGQQLWIGSPPA